MTKSILVVARQLEKILKDQIDNIIVFSENDDMSRLYFKIICPDGCLLEKCTYTGRIIFPETYPFDPPTIIFDGNVFHPNVYKDGKICLSILNKKSDETGYFHESELWTPVLDIRAIFVCVLNILIEPNLESPANLDACKMYRLEPQKFKELTLAKN